MQSYNLHQRAACYILRFPAIEDPSEKAGWPSVHDNHWLTASWLTGSSYRGDAKNATDEEKYKFHPYPRGYVERILALFPDHKRMAHLFSGLIPSDPKNYTTIDWDTDSRADFICDVRGIPKEAGVFDLVLADPPTRNQVVFHPDPKNSSLCEPPADTFQKPVKKWERWDLSKEEKKARREAEQCSCAAREKGCAHINFSKAIAKIVSPGGYLVWLDTTIPVTSGAEWIHCGLITVAISSNRLVRTASIFYRYDESFGVPEWMDAESGRSVRRVVRKTENPFQKQADVLEFLGG